MSLNAGTLYYTVDARTEGLLKAERQVDSSMKRVEGSTQQADRSFNKLTASVMRASAALISLAAAQRAIRAVVSQTAEFEQSLLGIQAVSGATADQMKSLETQARQLGATTVFSAKQAADAQGFLARAGFEVNEILGATPGILELAVAGEMDLAQAADIASNVLAGMRLEVDQLNRVNDVLAATAASANTNVYQLGDGLSYAAPFAAGLSVSLEETSAAIAAVSDAGIQGSRAGRAVGAVFRQLTRITPQSQKALAAYGLTMDDLSVSTHGLTTVMQRLRDAGLSESDVFQIFGTEAGAAAQILMHSADRVGAFTDELENVEGAASRMAQILGSGLTASLNSFTSAASEAVLVIGRDSGFSGALQTVLDTSAGVINNLSGMTAEMADNADEGSRQQVVINGLADALRILAVILAGRLVGALGSATAAKLAATHQSIAYQAALARMAGVSTTAAAAQTALAAATRAGAAAMALVGGPAGAAVLAAYGIYHFREELGLVQPEITASTDEVAKLTEGLESLTKAEAQLSLTRMVGRLAALRAEAAEVNAEIARVNQEPSSRRFGRDTWALDLAERQDETRPLRDRVREIEQSSADTSAAIDEYVDHLKRLDDIEIGGTGGDGGGGGGGGSTGEDEAKRREREWATVQRQLATERETIEREYRERNRIILENTAEGSQEQLAMLARSSDERQRLLDAMTERAVSGLRTESERIRLEYERRNEQILAVTDEGGRERTELLERNQQHYLERLREHQEREAQQELTHQERLLQQQREADIARIQQLTGFHEEAARKIYEIQQRTADPMRTLTEDLQTAFLSLDDTISSAFVRGMSEGQGFNEILNTIGQTVLGSLLQSFIKLGVQMAINAATGQAAQAAATAQAAASGAATLAAWQPAAIAASIASFGAAAGIGTSAYLAAQTAGAASGFMSQVATGPGRKFGGSVSPGTAYPVTEDGRPELLTQGTRSYLIPGQGGSITRNDDLGGSDVNVAVQVINNGAPMEAQAEVSQINDRDFVINVVLGEVITGGGKLDKAMQSTYGIPRRGR